MKEEILGEQDDAGDEGDEFEDAIDSLGLD